MADGLDEKIARLMKNGAVGLLPSDTIYGLSCAALNRSSIERIYAIKRRDYNKPFVILISSTKQLKNLGIDDVTATPARRYWPGKLTIICDAPHAPEWLHRGTNALAIRLPNNPELCDFIAMTGPIVSTSANLQGGKPAADVQSARINFGDKLDFYVDAGPRHGRPSTIVKPVSDKLKVIREGAVQIKREDLL